MILQHPQLPQAVIFDLDDTLIDFSGSVETLWRRVCAEAADEVRGLDAAAFYAAIIRTRDWFWADPERHRQGRADLRAASRGIVQEALRTLGHDAPELAAAIANRYRDARSLSVTLIPGAVETLDRLRSNGVRLALITNGDAAGQRAKIERFALAPYFDFILVEVEFGAGKPDPRVYAAALDALRSRPDAAWSIGDNLEWDIAAPHRLGLFTIWVDYARAGLPANAPAQPHRIIHALPDLLP
ncbi:MAG: HAD family hydrolase [Chloroflexi bacterium]|nr:HAD family hydrolase [Chloroflexota bacterium]